jgi:hypothetical protein
MMFPGGIDRALGIAEISEWFEWMRNQIPGGGIALPDEETATFFAGHALRLRDRLRDTYRHIPRSLEDRLIKSVVVYLCWERHRRLYASAKWPSPFRASELPTVAVERYIRPLDTKWGHHLVLGRDGFRYAIIVPYGGDASTMAATEVLSNALAGLLGLNVPQSVIVDIIRLKASNSSRVQTVPVDGLSAAPNLCAGVRYEAGSPSDLLPLGNQGLSARNLGQLIGALALDIWTLNLSERAWTIARNGAKGRVEVTLKGGAGCLCGGDWLRFLGSGPGFLPARQAVAPLLKKRSQIEPWMQKIRQLDLNPIWELFFRMPPHWYGSRRRLVAEVLDKLESRKWCLKSEVRELIRTGYLPGVTELQPRTYFPLDEATPRRTA